jgi:hypothetical protein
MSQLALEDNAFEDGFEWLDGEAEPGDDDDDDDPEAEDEDDDADDDDDDDDDNDNDGFSSSLSSLRCFFVDVACSSSSFDFETAFTLRRRFLRWLSSSSFS